MPGLYASSRLRNVSPNSPVTPLSSHGPVWQRVFTARSPGIARWGGVAAGLYCLLYAVAGALIGSAAKVILPNLATPDNAFAQVTKAALPAGLTGLVLAAALAAVMSTASATLLAASTILANDV